MTTKCKKCGKSLRIPSTQERGICAYCFKYPTYIPYSTAKQDRKEWFIQQNYNTSVLDLRELDIVTYYYGLDGQTPMSYTGLSKQLGMSREGARKAHNRVIDKLEKYRYRRGINLHA